MGGYVSASADLRESPPVCDVRGSSGQPFKANARLIAAAPELLEALTEMLERYVSLVNSGDAGKWNPEDEPQVQQARAAIRKATGAAE